MRINVGCGRRPLQGYLNIDRCRYPNVDYSGVAFAECDYREWQLPPGERAAEVRADQFLEHLEHDEGLAFLAWCRDLLAPDGRLCLSVPDLDAHLRDMRDGVQRVPLSPWVRSLAARPPYRPVENVFLFALYGEGHRMVYNESMLRAALTHAGFRVLSLERPDGANLVVVAVPTEAGSHPGEQE